ncbi:MAG: acyl-CoA thioesterase/BAAT N-terminal domain-containing protein [Candidatus Fermentibacteraceae bacterium]|nr:acyl-CoA thioesterase/BAAT N-terminal domain-containing protein [Candidatus Fermentibacteraceae bacterium]MBN2609677.1 acyl-CoA thioesterase/BAAT N-terminal domain-containing protein [Candidatus Fermentibacteraceae bacterium]
MEKTGIDIKPVESLADEPLTRALLSGLPPDTDITVRAAVHDEGSGLWASWGRYRSNGSGIIDLSEQTPSSGTISVADPSALLWSMRPEGDNDATVGMFEKNTLDPLVIEITAEKDGETVAGATITRSFVSRDRSVTREYVDGDGVTGTLFVPEGEGPFPVIVCLSGSGGGINEPRASLLANHGYAAFALAYFGAGSAPRELSEIPLEFFGRGIDWLKKHRSLDMDRLGLHGYSKGGELALLLGLLHPEVKAVAAFSGSAYVWQGLAFRRPAGSWSLGGRSLPYIPMKVPFKSMIRLMTGRKVAFRESYERGLRAVGDPGPFAIEAEKIQGPVLLVAGTDDKVWPSADFADAIVERLKQRDKNDGIVDIREEGAGHLVCLPYLPSAEVCRKLVFTSSDIDRSSRAMIKAWNAMLDLFREHLVSDQE